MSRNSINSPIVVGNMDQKMLYQENEKLKQDVRAAVANKKEILDKAIAENEALINKLQQLSISDLPKDKVDEVRTKILEIEFSVDKKDYAAFIEKLGQQNKNYLMRISELDYQGRALIIELDSTLESLLGKHHEYICNQQKLGKIKHELRETILGAAQKWFSETPGKEKVDKFNSIFTDFVDLDATQEKIVAKKSTWAQCSLTEMELRITKLLNNAKKKSGRAYNELKKALLTVLNKFNMPETIVALDQASTIHKAKFTFSSALKQVEQQQLIEHQNLLKKTNQRLDIVKQCAAMIGEPISVSPSKVLHNVKKNSEDAIAKKQSQEQSISQIIYLYFKLSKLVKRSEINNKFEKQAQVLDALIKNKINYIAGGSVEQLSGVLAQLVNHKEGLQNLVLESNIQLGTAKKYLLKSQALAVGFNAENPRIKRILKINQKNLKVLVQKHHAMLDELEKYTAELTEQINNLQHADFFQSIFSVDQEGGVIEKSMVDEVCSSLDIILQPDHGMDQLWGQQVWLKALCGGKKVEGFSNNVPDGIAQMISLRQQHEARFERANHSDKMRDDYRFIISSLEVAHQKYQTMIKKYSEMEHHTQSPSYFGFFDPRKIWDGDSRKSELLREFYRLSSELYKFLKKRLEVKEGVSELLKEQKLAYDKWHEHVLKIQGLGLALVKNIELAS